MYDKILKTNIKYIFLIIALSSFAFGIYSGQMDEVMRKAVKICLECCGIG